MKCGGERRHSQRDNFYYVGVCARAVASEIGRRRRLSAAEVFIQVFEETATGPLFEKFREAYLEELKSRH